MPPSTQDLTAAASDTVHVLHAACPGDVCFFIGSFACKVYGWYVLQQQDNFRAPNDVDVVICTDKYTQEELKRAIVARNPEFSLVNAKTPGATYKVLKHGVHNVKVDVLLGGRDLGIPRLAASHVTRLGGYPVAPLPFLVLLRLQGWNDHQVDPKPHLNMKQKVDARDLIQQLLPLAARRTNRLMADAATYLPPTFIEKSRDRVAAFIVIFPQSQQLWKAVGCIALQVRQRSAGSLVSVSTPGSTSRARATVACVVKNVPDTAPNASLEAALRCFGPIGSLRRDFSAKKAHFNFKNLEDAQRAIAASRPVADGGKGGVGVKARGKLLSLVVEGVA